MAHNLNYNDQTGTHSFFSVKEKTWHGVGTILNHYPTSAEAIKYAGLDFTVEKRPLFTYDTQNNEANVDTDIVIPELSVPDYMATVRKDTEQVLGVVGKDYEVVQNTEAFNFFDAIVDGEGIFYETAGALGNGERIFITAKLPDYIEVCNDDLIEKYLFLTTSHDGSGSITAAFTPVRVVCANTLAAALQNMQRTMKIRHTANAADRLKEAHKVMGITNKLADQLQDMFNTWAKIKITDPHLKNLIQLAMVPNKEVLKALKDGNHDELSTQFKNSVDAVYEYALTSPTQTLDTTRGTVFGAYNAITGYFQNVKDYKNSEAKAKSILFGGIAQTRTQTAFDLCNNYSLKGIDALMLN